MRPIHYEKFEELLAEIRSMIARYPYIRWTYEKTLVPYTDGDLRVIFYFSHICSRKATLGIVIDESITTTDIIKFVCRCEEMINVQLLHNYRRMTQLNIQNNAIPGIKKVIFNKPATIVFWTDGTKTVVKAQGKERYDKEKGLAMAISKKVLGNEGNYYDTFKKFLD